MSSSPTPEFDTFLRNFITSHASTIFSAVPLPDHNESGDPVVLTLHANVLGNLPKEGALPASKSAIDAMPTVAVTEEDDCAICLTEYGDTEVKEMPCKHRYHEECIAKWLGMHGSCPVCRYEMPVDEEEEEKRRRDGGVGWQVVITVASRGPVGEQADESVEDMEIDLDVDVIGDEDTSMEDLD